MRRFLAASGVAIALGLLGCELDGPRPDPLPTPSPEPSFAPGTRWEAMAAPRDEINALQFVNPQVAWAAGGTNKIFKTEDGGATWTAPKAAPSVEVANLSELQAVSFLDPRHGYVGGSYGLFKTEDGGDTWTPVLRHETSGPPPYDERSLVLFKDYERGLAFFGSAFHETKDGGRTWTKPALELAGVPKLGLIGGQYAALTDAALHKARPDGTWEAIALPTTYRPGWSNPKYLAFHFLDDQNGWLAGNDQLFRTTDGGKKWTPLAAIAGETYVVRFLDAARGWVVGKGFFKATRTGGATWEDVKVGGNLHFADGRPRDIHILDADHVYAYGGGGIRRWQAP